MKISFVSSQALTEATRISVAKTQARLLDAQKELATGRHADVGQTLGFSTKEAISLRQEYDRLATIVDTNSMVTTRLDITQLSLQNIVETTQSFVGSLIGARTSNSGPELLQVVAKTGLASVTDALNVSVDGAYPFAGINSDVRPLSTYFEEPTGASRGAVNAAFQTAFGFAQSSPAVGGISAAAMKSFLDTDFAALFDNLNWSGTWSSASDKNVQSRISTSELIDTSVNANEDAIRKLASAFTMVADLGGANLSESTFEQLVDKAVSVASEALQEITVLQAKMGAVQERISSANERMSIQSDIFTNHINALESVDPFEASTRVTSLLAQIETSYALTARIQRMSLTNFI